MSHDLLPSSVNKWAHLLSGIRKCVMRTDSNSCHWNTQLMLVTGVWAAARRLSHCLFAVCLCGWSHCGKASWERRHVVWQLPVCGPDSGLVCVCVCYWLAVDLFWGRSRSSGTCSPSSHLLLTLAKCFIYFESSSGKKSPLNMISFFLFIFCWAETRSQTDIMKGCEKEQVRQQL